MEASASAKLDADGSVREVEWEAQRRFKGSDWLSLSARGERFGSFVSDPALAYSGMSWMLLPAERAVKGRKRLEITTVPDSTTWPTAPFAGEYEPSTLVSFDANWADLLAFARGAGDFHVVLRSQRGAIVKQASLSGADFVAMEDLAKAALAEVAAMAGNFREECEHTSDLYPIIMVT